MIVVSAAYPLLEELDTAECYRLLATQRVGRLGVIIEHYPEVLPVNYALDRSIVVFRSDVGPKLAAAHHANVTFEVDTYDLHRHCGWSVLVRGLAEIVDSQTDPERSARSLAADPLPWAGGDKPHLVRVIPHGITGRRLAAPERHTAGDTRGCL